MDWAQPKHVKLTDHEMRTMHPSEIGQAERRAQYDYKSQTQENQLMIFNLPNYTTLEEVKQLCSVKGVRILEVQQGLGIDEVSTAYVKVTLESPKQVKTLKDALYNKWIDDKKLKVKSREELGYESFNNRTIIIHNIPVHYKNEHIMEAFQECGCIVGIELPLMDPTIHEQIKNKTDEFYHQRRDQEKKEFQRAQALVKESIETYQEYQQFLVEHFGEDRAQELLLGYSNENKKISLEDQYDILHNQRKVSIHNILTQLKVESSEVNKARDLLLKLKERVDSENVPSLETSAASKPQTEEEKKIFENAVRYITNNRQEIDDTTLDMLNKSILKRSGEQLDPLENLMHLSRSELATAYDYLISTLSQREYLIEKRIKEQVNYLGKDERILFEGKDFNREREDIKNAFNPFNQNILAEEFLSVSEQVRNVIEHKDMSPEEKLTQIVNGIYDPLVTPNFNKDQLAFTENSSFFMQRDYAKPDVENPPSMARLMFSGAPLKAGLQSQVDETVQMLRESFDTPFDELYHKEKKLIDQVVKAELALKAKEEKLEIPFGAGRYFRPDELPKEVVDQSPLPLEHQFLRDQRNKNERLLNDSVDNSQGSSKYEMQVNETNELKKLLDDGLITKKEYDTYLKKIKEENQINLGYAFVTFSHTEETKLALVMTKHTMLDGFMIETSLKGKLDHKDLDTRYSLNKLKNESQLVDEIAKLREAKQELREFEKDIDKELPSLKKFRKFQKMARDFVEDAPSNTREVYERTAEQEEFVNQKMRQLQKENPNVDYTQLFDTERAEQARKNQHKKSLAAYKAFQFLKHGIEMQGKTKQQKAEEPKKNPLQTNDPYDFPPLQETVSRFLTKDKYPKLFDGGEAFEKPGRKFQYTEQDFLEAYFGKDFARQTSLEVQNDNPVFGFNESLKNRYPIEKYLQTPILEAQRKKIQESIGYDSYNQKDIDPNMAHLLSNFDQAEHEEQSLQDRVHPNDPKRTMLTDLEKKVESYINKRQKMPYPSWNPRDFQMMQESLLQEYDDAEGKYYEKEFESMQEQQSQQQKQQQQPEDQEEQDTKQDQKFEPSYEGEQEQEQQPQQQQQRQYNQNRQQNYQRRRDQDQRRLQRQSKQSQQSKIIGKPGEVVTEVEAENDEYLDQGTLDINKEFIYDYTHRTRTDPFYDSSLESTRRIQNFEKVAEDNNMTTEELLDSLKHVGRIPDGGKVGGEFTDRNKFGMLYDEQDVQNREKKRRDLNDFAKESESEREDEDIYAHYMEQMNKAKKEKVLEDQKLTKEQRLAREKLEELEKLFPETPRFEGFFRSQSKGKHPFEEDEYKFDKENEEAEQQRRADEEFDELLYQRELQGRLMGEKLTPRQFATLFKIKENQTERDLYEMDDERQQFITARDQTKILEEMIEAERRNKVKSGEWTEKESHTKIREQVREFQNNIPNYKQQIQMETEIVQMYQVLSNIKNPKQTYDKEYYFDEGLGETLQEHVQRIKDNFPELEVSVKKDRDGFNLVKTTYKPKYKYDLDQISNFDPETYQHKIKESMEAVMKQILPIGDANLDFSKLDKETLEKSMKLLLQFQKNGEDKYELDAKSEDMMRQLIDERFHGKYKDDPEGFAHAYIQLQENATYDKSKKVPAAEFGFINKPQIDKAKVFEELDKEKDQIQSELMEQLASRIREHLFLKERKPSDFVKGRRNEQDVFANQVEHYERSADILQDKYDELTGQQDTEQFDKEAYYKLKAEIKSRRDAKERLLRQGFPELKPYITI